MRSREPWATYVARVMNGMKAEEAAERAGVHASTIRRWLSGDNAKSAEAAIQFARGMGVRPAEALVYCGLLEPDEIEGTFEVVRSPSEWGDEELLAELGKRLAERPARREIDNYGGRFSVPDDDFEGREDRSGLR